MLFSKYALLRLEFIAFNVCTFTLYICHLVTYYDMINVASVYINNFCF